MPYDYEKVKQFVRETPEFQRDFNKWLKNTGEEPLEDDADFFELVDRIVAEIDQSIIDDGATEMYDIATRLVHDSGFFILNDHQSRIHRAKYLGKLIGIANSAG